MATGENMVLMRKANAFRIWRLANSVNWDCTAVEIARELNLSPETVHRICKLRGWDLQEGSRSSAVARHAVDRMIKS